MLQTQKATLAFRFLLATTLVATAYLATTSSSISILEDVNDKVEHAFAFFTLALLADFSWPESGFGPRKILFLLGYGMAIEITQYFLPDRTCSLFDLGADGVGLFLYWMAIPLLKNVPPLSLRWKEGSGPG
jgi:VanZ family protein